MTDFLKTSNKFLKLNEKLLRIPKTPWTPEVLSEEFGWWDASDTSTITHGVSNVSQWNDKSGNSFHVLQDEGAYQPSTGIRTINGLNVIDFDGSQSLFNAVDANNLFTNNKDIYIFSVTEVDAFRDITTCIVSYKNRLADYEDPFRGAGFATATFLEGLHYIDNSYLGTGTNFATFEQDGKATDLDYGFATGGVGLSVVINSPDVMMSRINRTSSQTSLESRLNGYTNSTSLTNSTPDEFAPTFFTFGSHCSKSFQIRWLDGVIGEVIICSNIDINTVQKIEGYLAHKWGTTAKLSVSHPYKNIIPTI